MDTQTLRIFVDVARRESFAAVARDRNCDPSSISRAVALLEDDLGVRLFHRTTRSLTLTEAGELYLRRVEGVTQELDAARDEAVASTSGPNGVLRLTASVAFGMRCLAPLLPAFRTAFPGLKLELILTDANLDLVAERIDLAIRLGPSIAADVVGVKLFTTTYRVCASPAYLAKSLPLATPADITQHSCLLFSLPEFRTRWLFRDQTGAVTEVPVHGDIVISNAMALRDCALSGLGPVLLADWLISEDIKARRLLDLFPCHQVTATSFETAAWLLYPSRAFLPNKVRVTIDFLKAHLGKRRG